MTTFSLFATNLILLRINDYYDGLFGPGGLFVMFNKTSYYMYFTVKQLLAHVSNYIKLPAMKFVYTRSAYHMMIVIFCRMVLMQSVEFRFKSQLC